jgi:hypothetical protein
LINRTSSSVSAVDYQFDISKKNGGAGNAYKAVGSGIGGLLFQYESTDKQCGLLEGEKYWVYVFVLPNGSGTGVKADNFVCYDKNNTGGGVSVDFDDIFKDTVDLYTKAGFVWAWKTTGTKDYAAQTKRLDSVATYNFFDTLVITTAPKGYSCGTKIPFRFDLVIDSIARDTIGRGFAICASDTVDENGKRSPNHWFKRNLPKGKYKNFNGTTEVTSITPWPVGAKRQLFYYYYDKCPSGTVSKPIVDTLYLIDVLPDDSIGIDTVVYCRRTNDVSIVDENIWGKASYPGLKPDLSESNSTWEDWGITQERGITDPDHYGTTTKVTSLTNHKLNLSIMRASIGYNYMWTIQGMDCFVDDKGKPGWGILTVILQDPYVAQDYTAQLCMNDIGKFDLNTYTGLAVNWKWNDGSQLTGNAITPSAPAWVANTYKFNYEAGGSDGCGSGKGVFYVKITKNIKAPKSKSVKFCNEKLPATINLNDILGVGYSGLKWKYTSGDNKWDSEVFDGDFGILDINKYVAKHKAIPATKVVFETTGAVDCGIPSGIKVEIDFTGTL